MMLTNLSINWKIKIQSKSPSTVTMIKIFKISKTIRKAVIKIKANIKFLERCMVLRTLKTNKKIRRAFIKAKSNSSRKTFNKHFFWVIMLKS